MREVRKSSIDVRNPSSGTILKAPLPEGEGRVVNDPEMVYDKLTPEQQRETDEFLRELDLLLSAAIQQTARISNMLQTHKWNFNIDYNKDGKVDKKDYMMLLNYWGNITKLEQQTNKILQTYGE
jgi:hypothetical protein